MLSNPRLDSFETTNVSPPRLDTAFSTARVRIMSMAGLGSDPLQNFHGDDGNTPPSHDVYNFGQRNYRVPKDVDDFWTEVSIAVWRTHIRNIPKCDDEGEIDFKYRVNGVLQVSTQPREVNNFFALNPGSDYAIPHTNNLCPWIFPGTAADLSAFPEFDFSWLDPFPADGTVHIGNLGFGMIRFKVRNDQLTKFNKDFNIVIFRTVDNAECSVGENNECHVTILFDDTDPPAGSVDEFYNTDYGSQMKPPGGDGSVQRAPPGDRRHGLGAGGAAR